MAESFCPFATSMCSSWSLSRVQLCATPWSLPGSSIHGIFQARILEWVAIFFLQGNLPDPGIKPMSPLSPSLWADSLIFNLRICCNLNSFFFLFLMFPNIHSCVSHSVIVVSDSLWPHGLQFTRLLCPWSFPGKDAGVGCHFLLQGIFPTPGSHHISSTSRWALYCWIAREAHLFIYLPLKQVYCRLTDVFQDWKFLWVYNHNILRKFRTLQSMH